jgi:VCBS repeat-containing protein
VAACASTGNLAQSVAAHAAAAGMRSYVFVPADLEHQKIVATGIYGCTLVAVDGTYDDLPANDTVTLQTLAGTKRLEGAMVVRSADGVTVVFNDIVFNMDKKTDFLGWAFTTVMGSAPGPRMSRLAKLLLVGDKAVLRGELQGLADLPGLTRLIVAHEKVAHGADARAALVSALGYL